MFCRPNLEGSPGWEVNSEQCCQMGDEGDKKRPGGNRDQCPRDQTWTLFRTRRLAGLPGGERKDAGSDDERDDG